MGLNQIMTNTFPFEKGYAVIEADEPLHLENLRKEIFSITKEVFQLPDAEPEAGFNNFHKNLKAMSLGELNKLKIDLIQRITLSCNTSELVFKAFERSITMILGPDILAQKGCNLVLQPPLDPNPSELHRDTPANSPYELVVWVPLVKAYATKTMYILTADDTKKAFDFLEKSPMEWDEFERKSKTLSKVANVDFGKALIFNASLLHGSEINSENETRVSLNIRYKNLFSPSGFKNQLHFFKPIKISDFTRIGGEVEMQDLLK